MIVLNPFKNHLAELESQSTNNYYLYELEDKGNFSLGLVGTLPLKLCKGNKLLQHENIKVQHVQELYEEISSCRVQKKPLIVAYKNNSFRSNLQAYMYKASLIDQGLDIEGVKHRLWQICDPIDIEDIKQSTRSLSKLCIADGHHRLAAINRYYLENSETLQYVEPSILIALFSTSELRIRLSNIIFDKRLIKDISVLNGEDSNFDLIPLEWPRTPSNVYEMTLFFDNDWYILKIKCNKLSRIKLNNLFSIEIFNECLYKGLMENCSSKVSKMEIYNDRNSIDGLLERVDSHNQIGVILYKDCINALIERAEIKRLLAPSSTYFEPKLLHEFVAYSLCINNSDLLFTMET